MRSIYILSLAAIAPLAAHALDLPAPVTDDAYRPVNRAEAELGQLLFYDPILSGNRNISCATCHHPKFGTADGVSLSLGEGGIGLGPDRRADPDNLPEQRIPRNAPGLFNLGAHEFTVMFHDGRIEVDKELPGGIRTPMDEDMNTGFATLLSAQTMFPVLSADEMAGHYSENDVSQAVRQGRITGEGGAWDILSQRIAENPIYAHLFKSVYPDIEKGHAIMFTDISNAIGAFIELEWRSDQSLFDRVLRGEAEMSPDATAGMELFYGDAGCATCHSGPFQTDHSFHNMGVPQFGPGKAARFETHARDLGRARVTGDDADAYAFRTPSLRNVTKTAPYGHTGAYRGLGDFIRAHVDPVNALSSYNRVEPVLPALEVEDFWVMDRPEEVDAIRTSAKSFTQPLSDLEVSQLVAFLATLEDPDAIEGRLGIPQQVPSGLPIDR
ncbi:cytochrome c peroxidase [Litoreibacter ponti]|uniref:Cytochrome c peroxidase n=1 Tax=Litoreibacter ponti TaxID=1510457 RepID=A0A2T6BJN6_9RHOB|nr:cytochrome c peroxidase [Litoreibacter ponti]PTX56281.1 cytochrome c peroxidase [Litoreibacter ponti]